MKDMKEDVQQFINNNWNYYLMLENDFINITRYIKLDKSNFKTFSDEIIKLLQSIGAECDLMFKKICNINLKQRASMNNYVQILNDYPQIISEKIIVKSSDIVLQPFKFWKKTSPGKLEWWNAYNLIKHNREGNYKLGKFGNLLYSLAALYFLEMYFCRRVGRLTNNIDTPNEKSKIFIIKNWKVNPTEKTIFINQNIAANDKIDIELPYIVGSNELEVYYEKELLVKTTMDKKSMGNYIEVGKFGKVSHYIKTTGDWSLNKGKYLFVKISR